MEWNGYACNTIKEDRSFWVRLGRHRYEPFREQKLLSSSFWFVIETEHEIMLSTDVPARTTVRKNRNVEGNLTTYFE